MSDSAGQPTMEGEEFALDPELLLHTNAAVVGCSAACLTAAHLLPHTLQHSTVLLLLCPVQRAVHRLLTRDGPPPRPALEQAAQIFYELWDQLPLNSSPLSDPQAFLRYTAALQCPAPVVRALTLLCDEVAAVVWGPSTTASTASLLHLYFSLLDKLTVKFGNRFMMRGSPVTEVLLNQCTAHRTAPVHRITLHRHGVRRHVFARQLFIDQLALDELVICPLPSALCQASVTQLQHQSATAAGQLVYDYCGLPPKITPRPPKHHSVVIVGAGAAALGASLALNAAGITDILIIEGGSRVGGRVNSVYPDLRHDAPVELGAQWIHGQHGNALYDLIVDTGLVSQDYSVDGLGHFFTSEGYELNSAMAREVWDFFNAREEVLSTMEVSPLPSSEANISPDTGSSGQTHSQLSTPVSGLQDSRPSVQDSRPSVQDVFGFVEFERKVLAGVTNPLKRQQYKALYDWCIKWYLADNSCDHLSQLATTHWSRFKFCSGEYNVNPRKGMTEALKGLYRRVRAEVWLGTRVLRLSYASRVVPRHGRLMNAEGGPAATLTCSDGSVVGADAVLVTPSVGVLKENPSLFQPALPSPVSTALYSLGFGTLDKIVLEYRECWWQKYDGESLQLVWLPTANKCTEPDRWEEFITGFDVTYGAVPRLTGWVSGPGTVAMERCSEADVAARCTRILRTFLARDDVPPPHKVYRSQWASDPLFRGSYAHPSMQFESLNCTSAHLNTPVTAELPDPTVQVPIVALAGEANSEYHFSTVHGALENGVSQAQHFLPGRRLADMSLIYSKL